MNLFTRAAKARLATVVFIILTIIGDKAYAQMETQFFLPCSTQLRSDSKWVQAGENYAKHYKHAMPMTEVKRCDVSFLRTTDSVRFRISFCHETPVQTAALETDSAFSRQVGSHQVAFTRVRLNGRKLYDLQVRSGGCSHPWGTLIRAEELPVMEDFLKDLRLEELRD